MLSETARAKVNLYLHVGAVDARDYHPLQSLVVFADTGDDLTLGEGGGFALTIEGPFGAGLETGEGNLIVRAVRAFEAATGVMVDRPIHLTKNLPLASGIGGGSADAGAALRLLRQAYRPDMPDAELEQIAARTGADGVMCLWSRCAVAEGYGEKLTFVDVAPVAAVLVNPGIVCSTAEVYHGFDDIETQGGLAADLPAKPGLAILVEALARTRNDLQRPAIRLQPVIAQVLTALEAQPETRFARMSGSGATCFALCETDEAAWALGSRMQALWPAAWVRPCRLG